MHFLTRSTERRFGYTVYFCIVTEIITGNNGHGNRKKCGKSEVYKCSHAYPVAAVVEVVVVGGVA